MKLKFGCRVRAIEGSGLGDITGTVDGVREDGVVRIRVDHCGCCLCGESILLAPPATHHLFTVTSPGDGYVVTTVATQAGVEHLLHTGDGTDLDGYLRRSGDHHVYWSLPVGVLTVAAKNSLKTILPCVWKDHIEHHLQTL